MTDVIAWMQTYQREIMMGAFFALQGIFLLFLAIISYRIKVVGRKIDRITGQAESYLKAVLKENSGSDHTATVSEVGEKYADEEENRLISAVLREIFP